MSSSRYWIQILIKIECSRQILEKPPNTNFHENPFSRSRIVPCGLADMMKLTANFRNFGKTPKNDIVTKSV